MGKGLAACSVALGGTLLLASSALLGCAKTNASAGCLGGGQDCRVASPCAALNFTGAAMERLEARPLTPRAGERRGTPDFPGGLNAIASGADVLIGNAEVVAVIAGIGNQNYVDPHGGSLLDLSTRGDNNDGLNQVLQVTGILPGDAAHYESLQLIDESPFRVAVQVKGTLDGHPDIPIYTLYEIRPGDPGVRIRTEIVNGSPDQQLFFLSDGFYWSKREPIPFTPELGGGFVHPSFGLTTINDAFARFPYVAASLHAPPYSSYAMVGCNQSQLEGFNSESISAAGLPRRVVPPRDYQVYERFLAVASGEGAGPAIDQVMAARRQLYGESFVTLTGHITRPGSLYVNHERETSVLITEGHVVDDPAHRKPWTQVVPNSAGTFTARVPAGKTYVVTVTSFGIEKQAEQEFSNVSADLDLGTFTLPSTATVEVSVSDMLTLAPLDAEIFVVPADSATAAANAGSFHGQLGICSPWLGPPSGSSPACNRVLTSSASPTVFEVPAGNYYFYAFKGPFWSLDRQTVSLTPTSSVVQLKVRKLALQPAGTLGADLHVHGAASFDSSIPDLDRVRSFSASDMDVIVATDHDVVTDYSGVLSQLGLQSTMTAVQGVETTGHIPFLKIPGYGFPLVIGHYNFWPLKFDETKPRNGGPMDEYLEPGQLFDDIDQQNLWDSIHRVRELNHPYSPSEFGRDLGWPRAVFLNATQDLPRGDDGTNNGVFVRARGVRRNIDHDAQEVMNGTENSLFLPYRAFWWFMLNQGELKTGTANSDSHGLTDDTVGVPRNLIYASTQGGPSFNVETFNQAILSGSLIGTNGPVIEATMDAAAGGTVPFGLTPFTPLETGQLHLKVTSAPWVPVQEIRIIVNGQVVQTITGSAITQASDPRDTTDAHLLRYQGDIPLAPLLTGVSGDAWLVVEAGRKLLLAGDLGGGLNNAKDGIPDTTDNNNDGVVDARDVASGQQVGPLNNPAVPTDPADPQFDFSQVINNGYPAAFTNPFVMDRNGNGKFDAPGVRGGR